MYFRSLTGPRVWCYSRVFLMEDIMFGGLLLAVCVILQFHYHDSIPWYLWAVAVIAQCVAFGEPSMRIAASKKT
jgi:hypothetical protein